MADSPSTSDKPEFESRESPSSQQNPTPSDYNRFKRNQRARPYKTDSPEKADDQYDGLKYAKPDQAIPMPPPIPPKPRSREFYSSPDQKRPNASAKGWTSEDESITEERENHDIQGEKKNMLFIDNVRVKVKDLLVKIKLYDGVSAETKYYIYLDGMLTTYIESLDAIDCRSSNSTRQYRKTTIDDIHLAGKILKRIMEFNADMSDLLSKTEL